MALNCSELQPATIWTPLVVFPDTTVMVAITQMQSASAALDNPQSPLSWSANLQSRTCASCVIVVEKDQPIGILTAQDVVRLVAEQASLNHLTLRQAMTYPLVTLQQPDCTDPAIALRLFQQHSISHLPIVDQQQRLVGIVTRDSLLMSVLPPTAGSSPLPTVSTLEAEAIQNQAILAAIPDLMFRVGKDGIYRAFVTQNRAFGVLPASVDLTGQRMTDLLPPEMAERQQRYLAKALQTGELQIYEQHIQIGDRHQDEEVRVIKSGDDEALFIIRDISDRKRAEAELLQATHALEQLNTELERRIAQRTAELQQREAQFQDFLDNAHDLVQIVNLATGRFEYVNRAWREVLGYTAAEVADLTIVEVLHPDYRQHCCDLMAQMRAGEIAEVCPVELTFLSQSGQEVIVEGNLNCRLEGSQPIATRAIFRDIRQRRRAEHVIRQQAQRETLLRQVSTHIRQTLDLQTIFDTACQEIREVVAADRVAIFRFSPELNYNYGEFVAESVVVGFSSVLGAQVHDHCFGEDFSSLYSQGRFYAVADILNDDLADCHSALLTRFDVRANLLMPLLYGQQLWGLLCVHQCAAPRQWQTPELDLTQQLANQLAIAIQQASLYDRVQAELRVRQQAEAQIARQLRQQQALEEIGQQIRQSLAVDKSLTTAARKTQEILQGDRVIIFRLFENGCSQIVEEAVVDGLPQLKNRYWDDEVWSQEILELYWQGQPRIVPDVMSDRWTDCLMEYSLEGQIQSKIVAPILQDVGNGEDHRWVAPWSSHKLWGILVIHACHEKRVWQESEARILQQIANQLAIAVQQANLFDQLQRELSDRQLAQRQLTERNQELARATRLKDEFLANMSHELRTPLNAILGMTEGLQEGVFGPLQQEQIRPLKTIERSGSHLLALINDILDVAKIEAGQIELERQSVSVKPLCQSSLTFVKQQALKKRIQLQFESSPHLPPLWIDERRIRQVLINLLTNAVKFTPEKGHVTLVARLLPPSDAGSPSYLQIAVTDTGIGIAPEHLNRLFQPFVQIDSALNRQYPGTGLGLALVKRLVELHGGTVGVTSEIGVGSCFTVDLPCATSASPAATVLSSHALDNAETLPAVSPSASVILLVEDNEANVMTLSNYLQAKGYAVVLARNGLEAIAQAQNSQPSLILMDIQMPGMDGLEAIHRLRQIPDLTHVPIIALTALAMEGDRDRCLAAGANEYLSKPVRLKQLVATVRQHLGDSSNS